MSSNLLNDENKGDIVIYQSESGETKIDVRFQDETVWLTQAQLCELYQSSKANVSEHIKNIFEEGELEQSAVVRKIRTTAADGKTYAVNHYNLDMIISLGYRIKSSIATQFRRWATERLKEYMIPKCYLIDWLCSDDYNNTNRKSRRHIDMLWEAQKWRD